MKRSTPNNIERDNGQYSGPGGRRAIAVRLSAFFGIFARTVELCPPVCYTIDKGRKKTMKVAIVEDEDAAAEKLQSGLERYARENGIAIEAVRFVDPTLLLEAYRPVYDIILMDIVMPHVNGFAAAKKLRELDEEVLLIFVTNMQNYAVKGYEVSAFDFIVKPFTYGVLEAKLARACKRLGERQTGACISVTVERSVKVLPVLKVHYVEIRGHTLTYHTQEGCFTARDTLEHAEAMLGAGFARCNNSFLVNLAHVRGVDKNNVIVAGEMLAVSRNKKKEFMQALANYLGKKV